MPGAGIAAYDPKTGAVESAGPQLGAPSANGSTPTNGVPVASVAAKPQPLPALADEPDLIGAIVRDYARLGVAGETETTKALYVVASSRKLNKPLGALVMGDSASGKSLLIGTTADLMPPDEVVRATRFTPQALYHLDEPIKNKFVAGGERARVQDDTFADQNAALRQLRSERSITKQITERDGNGFRTREVTVDGPIAFVESTTLNKAIIFPEDLNRGLILKTDATEDQNRRVMKEMTRPYSPNGDAPPDSASIIKRHRDFQRSLKYVDVRIPYARALANVLPAKKTHCRRVFGQVLTTVETIAYLHQHRRNLDEHGHLLATLDDYRIARSLLVGSVRDSLDLRDSTYKAFLKLRAKSDGDCFSSTLALKAAGFGNKVTRDKELDRLVGFGLIRLVKPGAGPLPAIYRFTGLGVDELVLPSAERLAEVCVNA
jgi:hypothetical protein